MSELSLNLLIIEDSEDDAMLLLRELKRGGYKIHWQRVENAIDLQLSLTANQWDIIITDHNMPNFDSSAAIQIIKKNGADIPVIIVSGSIGEDIAVKSMKAGANDYILKGNYSRLIPAIERELREAKSRLARRDAEAVIHHMAYHDSLTGLFNRHEFEQRLDKLHKSCLSNLNSHVLLYLDLDQFKIVNDTCGHNAGDELLKKVARLFESKIRGNDVIARLGGDEFGVLLENCPLEKAQELANNLCEAVQNFHFKWNEKMFSIGVSIGLVIIDSKTSDIGTLMSNADMACYAAKDQGRNSVQIYQEADHEFIKRRGEMDWSRRIDYALEQQQFCLYQQSIVPLQTQQNGSCHHELLLRMKDDEGNIYSPNSFIPAAERFRRMRDIDRYVIHLAFKYLASDKSAKQHYISINLSGQSLGDDTLFTYVSQQLKKFDAPAQRICFEITETAAIDDVNIAIDFIKQIKLLGCKCSLDDFGSGLSSFSYLKLLPVDYLKIDGAFIQNIVTDPMDKSIVEAINSVAHKAGMKTIAEYVESQEIKQCLSDMGVDFAQGYAIDKPTPITIQE